MPRLPAARRAGTDIRDEVGQGISATAVAQSVVAVTCCAQIHSAGPTLGTNRIGTEDWTSLLLSQAAKHCTNGSQFSITKKTYGALAHDKFQIAAFVCWRPEIKETKLEGKGRERGTLNFTCIVTKLDEAQTKVARSEKVFSWATDHVPPSPHRSRLESSARLRVRTAGADWQQKCSNTHCGQAMR